MQWMLWVEPTVIFFSVIGLLLLGMLIWEIRQPTVERRGLLLPMATTRGDRFFISLLAGAYLNAFWLGWVPVNQWWAVGLSGVLLVMLMRWG